ncbi:MAG: hypothetical protein M3O15_08730 [Acidobacteriota bacterium]|nr:hypothetical protein [Acidobacteriota bacterium]
MRTRRVSPFLLSLVLSLALLGRAQAAPTEIKGAAILDHPCGKVAVKNMDLVHAGKVAEANKLTTKKTQDQWKAMPVKDRKMMAGMAKELSVSGAQFSDEIKAGGLLVLDGTAGTLTVKREHKDANGSVSDTFTQKYVFDGGVCLITH